VPISWGAIAIEFDGIAGIERVICALDTGSCVDCDAAEAERLPSSFDAEVILQASSIGTSMAGEPTSGAHAWCWACHDGAAEMVMLQCGRSARRRLRLFGVIG